MKIDEGCLIPAIGCALHFVTEWGWTFDSICAINHQYHYCTQLRERDPNWCSYRHRQIRLNQSRGIPSITTGVDVHLDRTWIIQVHKELCFKWVPLCILLWLDYIVTRFHKSIILDSVGHNKWFYLFCLQLVRCNQVGRVYAALCCIHSNPVALV